MPSRFPSLRFSLLALAVLVAPVAASAQDEAPSLGDVARSLRQKKDAKSQPSLQPDPVGSIIDNDNLAQVMEDAKNSRPVKSDKTVFSIDTASNTIKLSSPDVTCSLAFNSRTSSLLIKPVLVEDLPLTELLKIDGPGSIQDESLQLEVFNGTDWDLREITIGLTLERKPGENAELAAQARVIPAAIGLAPQSVERRSDVTLLYHLKAEAKPFTTSAFHENIGITPGPDEDWRWSIVEAKGIRPSQTQSAPDSLTEPLFATPSALMPSTNEPQIAPAPATIPSTPDKPSPVPTPGPAPTPQQ
jgi:hypothetical protein